MEVGFIVLMALAIPIVVIWPVMIWAGAMRSLYKTLKSRAKSRATATETN